MTSPKLEDLSPNNRLLVEYMQAGRTLTNNVAVNSLKVGSLTSRVAELRRLGWPVVSRWKTDFHGRRYKTYGLEGVDNDANVG